MVSGPPSKETPNVPELDLLNSTVAEIKKALQTPERPESPRPPYQQN